MDSPVYSYPYQKLLAKLNFYLLLGLAATLFFDQGRYKLLNYLAEIVTLILVISCCLDKRNTGIRKQVFAGISIIGIFLLNQYLCGEQKWPKSEIKDLVFMFCVMAATAFLPSTITSSEVQHRHYAILSLMAAAAVTYVIYIYHFAKPYGVFTNPHYLSLQIVILVNIAIFFGIQYSGIKRAAAIAIIVISIFTLTLIVSRIAWVALAISLLIWGFFSFQHVRYMKVSACFIIVLGLYATTLVNYTGASIKSMATANNQPFIELWQDERVILWANTISMQVNSDLKGWLVGHGLGGFQEQFRQYSSYASKANLNQSIDFVFPHNFFLEVLYNNGIFGLLALFVPLTYIIFHIFKNTQGRNYNAILALALLAGVFIHTFFTLPLFTRFPSTTLGMIIGYCLWVNRSAANHANTQ